MSQLEQHTQAVYEEIEQTVSRGDLPDTIAEKGKSVYDEFVTHQNAWSRPEEHFAIACVYHAIRSEQLAYTLRDIAGPNDISNILTTFRAVCSETDQFPLLQDPEVFIDRIHEQLHLEDQTATQAKTILNDQSAETLSGRQPNATAAGSYYIAAKQGSHSTTQAAISEVANVSTLTIRNVCRELAEVE